MYRSSMVDLANEKVDSVAIDDLVTCVLKRLQVADGQAVSNLQFLNVLTSCRNELSSIKVELSGRSL